MLGMKLSDYLKIDGNSASRLAEAAGVAVSTITRAAKGEIMPSRQLMEAIYRHSAGEVTPNDFYDFDSGVHAPDSNDAGEAVSSGKGNSVSRRAAAAIGEAA